MTKSHKSLVESLFENITRSASGQNPFMEQAQASEPSSADLNFIGIEGLVEDLVNLLLTPTTRMIYLNGLRLSGKTMLLKHITGLLKERGELEPFYFNLEKHPFQSSAEIETMLVTALYQKLGLDRVNSTSHAPLAEGLVSVLSLAREQSINSPLLICLDELGVEEVSAKVEEEFQHTLQRCLLEMEGIKILAATGRRPNGLAPFHQKITAGVYLTRLPFWRKETIQELLEYAEKKGKIDWNEQSLASLMELTRGYPFLVQSLCYMTWEQVAKQGEGKVSFQPENLSLAMIQTVEKLANAFQWIWNGFNEVNRSILSILAEAHSTGLSIEDVSEALKSRNVNVPPAELGSSIANLCRWEIIREKAGKYDSLIPILREWILSLPRSRRSMNADQARQPLDPGPLLEEKLFRIGKKLFDLGDYENAIDQFHQALSVNPAHLNARIHLGKSLLEIKEDKQSILEFEAAYRLSPEAARDELVRALLQRSMELQDVEKAKCYDRILEIAPDMEQVREMRSHLLSQAGKDDGLGISSSQTASISGSPGQREGGKPDQRLGLEGKDNENRELLAGLWSDLEQAKTNYQKACEDLEKQQKANDELIAEAAAWKERGKKLLRENTDLLMLIEVLQTDLETERKLAAEIKEKTSALETEIESPQVITTQNISEIETIDAEMLTEPAAGPHDLETEIQTVIQETKISADQTTEMIDVENSPKIKNEYEGAIQELESARYAWEVFATSETNRANRLKKQNTRLLFTISVLLLTCALFASAFAIAVWYLLR